MRGRCDSREEDKRGEQPCVSEIGFLHMYFLYGQCVPKQYYNKLN